MQQQFLAGRFSRPLDSDLFGLARAKQLPFAPPIAPVAGGARDPELARACVPTGPFFALAEGAISRPSHIDGRSHHSTPACRNRMAVPQLGRNVPSRRHVDCSTRPLPGQSSSNGFPTGPVDRAARSTVARWRKGGGRASRPADFSARTLRDPERPAPHSRRSRTHPSRCAPPTARPIP